MPKTKVPRPFKKSRVAYARLLEDVKLIRDLNVQYAQWGKHYELPDGRCITADTPDDLLEFPNKEALAHYLSQIETERRKFEEDPLWGFLRTEADFESTLAHLDDYLMRRWNVKNLEAPEQLETLNRRIRTDKGLDENDVLFLSILQGELHIAVHGGVWILEEHQGYNGGRFLIPMVKNEITGERFNFQTCFRGWWDEGTPIQIIP